MNLHSFSSRGSGVCRSLFLRTLMVMMLFITGSNGIYAGEDKTATLSDPASHGSWNKESNQYSWDQIHKGSPQGEKDESQDNGTIDLTKGKLVELTFDNVDDIHPIEYGDGADLTSQDGMKLYLKSRLGIHDGKIDNKDKYIVEDAVFGHYFQNIPDADIYERSAASDYMRVVLGPKNSLSGHDGIKGIQETGQVTIGFWVNGNLAVNRGLAYDEPSMFYIAGNTYNGPNVYNNPHLICLIKETSI